MIAVDVVVHQGAFTLEVHQQTDARVTALFGPSGSGKTTTLDVIAGLRRPSRGSIAVGRRVLFNGADGVDLSPHLRHVGYVPQDVALFPHMTVRRNVLYGRREGQKLALSAVAHMLEIEPLLERRVPQLSGGEKQRVALARALMSSPELLLLDEPLAAVDVERRRRILPYVERVRDDLGIPIIYVSHDAGEVRQIADHVIVLEQGRVIRSGSPASVLTDR